MSRVENGSDAWLDTLAAEATERGCESPSETIEPRRTPRRADGEALLAELAELAANGEPLVLEETLGRGGMATVWLARQTRLGRFVAVKSVRAEIQERAAAVELLREAWVTGSLEHPNIVPIHDIVIGSRDDPRVVMKRIAGQSWGELLASRERRTDDLAQLRADLEILIQIVNAVRFAHAQDIIHRDLKPANVMIGSFGEVYVVDWGLAVTVDDSADGRLLRAVDEADKLAGTPAYMAPEMLGEGAVADRRTDVYLLGAMLLEVVSGWPPHRGSTLLAALEHVRSGEISIPADVPAELASLCRRALARDPDERPQTADEFLAELRGFLGHLSSTALAADAARALGELQALLATKEPDRRAVYDRFGECRFGFRAALASWGDNPVARRGLGRALEVMAEHELDRGDDGAASALLAEHPEPPAGLAERLAVAASERAERQQRLEKLEADFDASAGRLPRLVATLFVSLVWVAFPFLFELADLESRFSRTGYFNLCLAITAAWVGLLVVIFRVLREALRETRFNRIVVRATIIGGLACCLVMFGARQLGLPVYTIPVLSMAVWAIVLGLMAAVLERWLALPALAFVAGFVISSQWIELRHWALAGADVVVTVAIAWAWGHPPQRANSATMETEV